MPAIGDFAACPANGLPAAHWLFLFEGLYLGAGVDVAAAPQHKGLGLGLDLGWAEGLVGLQMAGADHELLVEPLAWGQAEGAGLGLKFTRATYSRSSTWNSMVYSSPW